MSLTANNKYSRCNLNTLTQIQTLLSLKQKTFSQIFHCSCEMCIKFRNISNIKLSILAQLFPKLYTPKELDYLNV